MSPRGLVLLLVVGLCAAQEVAPTTSLSHRELERLRHERAVAELLVAVKEKLAAMLVSARDAALSSVETVMGYVHELETEVLETGTDYLFSKGYEVNLTTVSNLFKSNLKTCVAELDVKAQIVEVIKDLVSCVSSDAASLKALIENMQGLWTTAQSMPETVMEVSRQCGMHTEEDEDPDDDVDPLELFHDDSDHDLAPTTNELLEQASKTMSKRSLWSFGRAAQCVKSVYSLAKSDMVSIPGQIVATAANAYRVSRAASGGIQTCVSLKMTANMPVAVTVASDVGTCLAKIDLDDFVRQYPALAGVKQLIDLARKLRDLKRDPSLGNIIDALPELVDTAGGIKKAVDTTGGLKKAVFGGVDLVTSAEIDDDVSYYEYVSTEEEGEGGGFLWNGAAKIAGYVWG